MRMVAHDVEPAGAAAELGRAIFLGIVGVFLCERMARVMPRERSRWRLRECPMRFTWCGAPAVCGGTKTPAGLQAVINVSGHLGVIAFSGQALPVRPRSNSPLNSPPFWWRRA